MTRSVLEVFPGPEGERLVRTLADEYREEGIQEGIQQGIQQGTVATAREYVLEVIAARFGEVPDSLRERLQRIDDPGLLRTLLRTAAAAESLAAFGRAVEGESRGRGR